MNTECRIIIPPHLLGEPRGSQTVVPVPLLVRDTVNKISLKRMKKITLVKVLLLQQIRKKHFKNHENLQKNRAEITLKVTISSDFK